MAFFAPRLNLVISNNHTTAYVDHHTGEILVSASTQEFAIARHLSKNTDVTAAINVGRVIAERCKECGIDRVFWRMNHVKRKEKVISDCLSLVFHRTIITSHELDYIRSYHLK